MSLLFACAPVWAVNVCSAATDHELDVDMKWPEADQSHLVADLSGSDTKQHVHQSRREFSCWRSIFRCVVEKAGVSPVG